jgi:hypothetical protein
MLIIRSRAHIFLVALCFFCCGRSELLKSQDGGFVATDACDSFAEQVCTRAEFCQVVGLFTGASDARSFTASTCRLRLKLACQNWKSADGSNILQAHISQCETRWKNASCPDAAEFATGEFLGCVFPVGNRADLASCTSSIQCKSLFCSESEPMCGVCKPPFPLGALRGAPCNQRGDFCARHLECRNGVCENLPTIGEACTNSCFPNNHVTCENNICTAVPVVDAGFSCGNTMGVSSTKRPPACAPGSDCSGKSDMGIGKCVPFAVEGTSCGYDVHCQFPARCFGKKCVLPGGACAP